jgi:hypothetical protein
MPRRKHRRGSPLYVTPAFELFPKSYGLVKKNLSVFALLYIFPLIIGLSNGAWVVDSRRHWHTDVPVGLNAVGHSTLPAYAYGGVGIALVFAMAIAIFLQVMTQSAQLEAAEGRKVQFSSLLKTAKARLLQMLGLYLAVGVVLLISFLPLILYVALGLPSLFSVILLVPPAIVLRRYLFAPYVLLEDDKKSVWEAMEQSAALSLKDSWSVYSLLGVMILFSLFGVVLLIGWIAAFLLQFFYSVAPALRYQELKKLG